MDNATGAERLPVAQLNRVDKVYGSGAGLVKALDQLDLIVRQGDYVAVMGASGSGKSTAMNILGCLDRPSGGSYRLNGEAVEDLDDDSLADLRNQQLGFVFQQFHLLPHATALENVMLPMVYAGFPPSKDAKKPAKPSNVSDWQTACRTGQINCPEANSSASRSPEPSSTDRACCWRMNPLGRSIHAPQTMC